MESSELVPPLFLCLLSIFHELTIFYDFGRVHITDLASLSFKSAFACCCCSTSQKLDSTPRCHAPSISPSFLCFLLCLCLPLAVQTWRSHGTARYYPDVTTNPSSTQNTATTKTSPGQKQTFAYTQTHTETTQHAPADSAGPGGKRGCLSLSSPTVPDNKSRKELPALSYRHELHHSYKPV